MSRQTARYSVPENATAGSKLRAPGVPVVGSSTATSGPMIGSSSAGKVVRAMSSAGTIIWMLPPEGRTGIRVSTPSAGVQRSSPAAG